MLIPATPEALITPAAHYLTADEVETKMVEERRPDGSIITEKKTIPGWAPLRSSDNMFSFGRMTGESKIKMAETSGGNYHMILETENRHVNFLQCPSQTRLGESLNNTPAEIRPNMRLYLFLKLFLRLYWPVLSQILWPSGSITK